MATGWLIASAPSESDANGAITGYWDGDEFNSDINAADFYSDTNNTINQVRQDEGTLQARFDGEDVRLLAGTRTITQAADNDAGNGWVVASAPDEGSAIDQYFDGAAFVATLDDADVLSKAAGETIESARQEEGTAQNRFSDVDIRIIPVNTVTAIV